MCGEIVARVIISLIDQINNEKGANTLEEKYTVYLYKSFLNRIN